MTSFTVTRPVFSLEGLTKAWPSKQLLSAAFSTKTTFCGTADTGTLIGVGVTDLPQTEELFSVLAAPASLQALLLLSTLSGVGTASDSAEPLFTVVEALDTPLFPPFLPPPPPLLLFPAPLLLSPTTVLLFAGVSLFSMSPSLESFVLEDFCGELCKP